jgi:hypothetical protein
MYGISVLVKGRIIIMTKTVYIIQWQSCDKTWLGDLYEDEAAAYKAINIAMIHTPIQTNYLSDKVISGKVIPVTLYTND